MTSTAQQPDHDHDLRDILSRLDDLTGRGKVSVEDVLDRFGATAFLPVLLVPALLVASPLSGIPLFSSICGLTIGLIALQLFLGRESLWLPGFMRRRRVDGDDLHEAIGKMSKVVDWLDRHTHDRLRPLTGPVGQKVVYFACMICGFCMPALEIIPFSSSAAGLAVLLLTAGLLTVDGLFILLGFIAMGCVAAIPFFVYSGVSGLLSGLS